jgi:hypothetical protein
VWLRSTKENKIDCSGRVGIIGVEIRLFFTDK